MEPGREVGRETDEDPRIGVPRNVGEGRATSCSGPVVWGAGRFDDLDLDLG